LAEGRGGRFILRKGSSSAWRIRSRKWEEDSVFNEKDVEKLFNREIPEN
jgi:hypothetical protein